MMGGGARNVILIIYSDNPDFEPIEVDIVGAKIAPPLMFHVDEIGVEYSAERNAYIFWGPGTPSFIGWIRVADASPRLKEFIASCDLL